MVVKDLNRWFKEKWVDVSRKDKDGKHPPCGRSKAKTSSKGYPKCRPSVKVSSKTPKTSGSMTEGQKRAATKRKRSKKQGVGGKPTIVKGMSDDERELHFQHQLHLARLTDQKSDESAEQYRQRMANSCPCGSGQPAVSNAHFEEPRCMTCIREQTNKFISQVFSQEEEPTIQANPRPDPATRPFSAGRYDQYPFGYDFSQKNAGEVMDLSFRLLKRPVSPEAKRHKLEYDTKYESTPERLKYREELKRERRHRGIDGKGGPDMSHTKDHTLVAEDPHTNRARHFKERGTLKSDPMDIAWLLVKGEW
jgi:hypothetical protein